MTGYIPIYIKKGLFQLIYHVTFKCNAKCDFCFNWRNINKKKGNELSLKEISKISKSMPQFPWLLLSGGEPLLRSDLVAIIKTFYTNNKIKHITLPTNGLSPERTFAITEKILKECKNSTITVAFSLDALGKKHDRMRGVEGCYKKTIESYNSLKPLRENKNLNVKFHTVVSNYNYPILRKLIRNVRELKPDMHTIEFLRGDPKNKNLNLPPKSRIDSIIKMIKNNYNYYKGYSNLKKHSIFMKKISSSIQKNYLHLFKEIITKKRQVIPCLAYTTNLVLYPYGDVSFCEPLKPFNNFRNYNYNYKKLINSPEAKKQKEIIKKKKCYCYHPCYQYLNILFDKKLMLKGVIKNVF